MARIDTVELVIELAARDDVAAVPAEESAAILDRVADMLLIPEDDRTKHWWWHRARHPFVAVSYVRDPGLALATWALLTRGEDEVLLTGTDSCQPPWRTYRGPPGAVFAAIQEAPFTEFFVTPPSGRWVAFDMHHDCIMLAGRIGTVAADGWEKARAGEGRGRGRG